MLDLIGSTVGMMVVMISAVVIAGALQLTRVQRFLFGASAGAWVGLATGIAAAGALAFTPQHKVPLMGVLVASPLLVTAALWAGSARVRATLLAIPMELLIGLNTFRVLGVLFLVLTVAGRLSGPFPYSAGFGDIITGIFAIPAARLALSRSQRAVPAIMLWNLFGTADLVAAVTLGITSAQGSSLQLIHAGAGSEAMLHLPFSLVPTVLVPFYLITHAVVAAQLSPRAARSDHPDFGQHPSGISEAR